MHNKNNNKNIQDKIETNNIKTNQDNIKIFHQVLKKAIDVNEIIGVNHLVYRKLLEEEFIKQNIEYDVQHTEEEIQIMLNDLLNLQEKTVQNIETVNKEANNLQIAIEENNCEKIKEHRDSLLKLQNEMKQLEIRVYEDALTKAFNRQWLLNKFLNNNTFQNDGILTVIDLNHFKIINDSYGHNIGDRVLTMLVEELLKINNNIVRFGGDEFLVFFEHEHDLKKINKIFEDITTKFKKQKVQVKKTNETFFIQFSYASIIYHKNDKFELIFEKADELMYKCKLENKKNK